jgi:predicted PurR-regulated permease PerM
MNVTLSDRERSALRWAILPMPIITIGVALFLLANVVNVFSSVLVMFFLAWLLAFLISPVADWLQRRLTRLPRPVAVVAVIVPVIVIGAVILVNVVASLAESFVELGAALPNLAANPPAFLTDLQRWLDGQGIKVDVIATFESILTNVVKNLVDLMLGLFGGVLSAAGTLIDSIIVVSLGVFMAIDRDKILRLGLDLTPPEKRDDAMLFRHSVGSAAAGFLRSQIVLGALYGVWAFLVSFVFGLPFGPATAFLAGLIMAIPIYGPYVSWLPPVVVAVLVRPEVAIPVAVIMLVGWFIDENVLAPLVRAGALELHPIVVTFAFLLGAELAGAIGAIVAIPMAAVIQAFVVKYIEQYRAERGWPGVDDPVPAATVPETGSVAG